MKKLLEGVNFAQARKYISHLCVLYNQGNKEIPKTLYVSKDNGLHVVWEDYPSHLEGNVKKIYIVDIKSNFWS